MPTSIYAPNLPPGEINVPTNLSINPTNLSFYSPISRPDPEESEDVLTNEIYVPSQLLDLYTLKGSKMLGSLLNPDLTTQYPALATGTPNIFNNPGGPIVPFRQIYNFARNGNTYLNHINNLLVDNSELSNTSTSPTILAITNLDTEHIGVNGGFPTNPLNDPTVYPPTSNHISPIRGQFYENEESTKFAQMFNPNSTYLTFIETPPTISATTNLDTEHIVPIEPLNDPTIYPLTSNHISPIKGQFYENEESTKFTQMFNPNSTYLTFIESGKDKYNKPYI